MFQICRHVVSTDDRSMPKSPKILVFNAFFVKTTNFDDRENFHLEQSRGYRPFEVNLFLCFFKVFQGNHSKHVKCANLEVKNVGKLTKTK